MAKAKKIKRRRRKFTLPLAVAIGFLPAAATIANHTKAGWSAGSREAGRVLLGYDWWERRFNPAWMMIGLFPIVLGGIAHRVIGGRLGVNRMLSSAGIPVIRI